MLGTVDHRTTEWRQGSPTVLAMAEVAGLRGSSSTHGLVEVGLLEGGPVVPWGPTHVPTVVLPGDLVGAQSIPRQAGYGLGCGARCAARRCVWVWRGLHTGGTAWACPLGGNG